MTCHIPSLRRSTILASLLVATLPLAGCGEAGPGPDDPKGDALPACVAGTAFDCEGTFGSDAENGIGGGKADAPEQPGVKANADVSRTQVWKVTAQWEDRDTPAARQAGPAWGENSGLNWDEKYALWVQAMERIDGAEGHRTFRLITPDGRTFEAPVLECADTAIFLRVLFASWYGLPFYLQATDGKGVRSYFGHFGWRTVTGRYPGSPEFAIRYKDHSRMTAADIAARGWPRDPELRKKSVYTVEDYSAIVGEPGALAGAYFDEVLLNKRVGHLLVLIMKYFGSINLADPANTYDLVPEAIRTGDFLVERWQRRGIGHTLVAKRVDRREDGRVLVELISGTMPPRQPLWEDAIASRLYFQQAEFGGPGQNSEGDAYAKLGGGLKRWRVAKVRNGAWVNTVMDADAGFVIGHTDYERIAARTAAFGDVIAQVSPTELAEGLLGIIESARERLRNTPASCAARTKREEAFADLYAVMWDGWGMSRDEVDATYRTLEDYVFAELVYTQSRTCCWNSSTPDMYRVIMSVAEEETRDTATGTCRAPTVFRAQTDGYAYWKAAAGRLGLPWRDWSEDEPCPQRAVSEDTIAETLTRPYCELPQGAAALQ